MFDRLLLEEVGQRLTKRPFQGFSWQCWANVIQVSPAISKTRPLWSYENHVLENELRLFGVKPEELEHQIRAYRKKSRVIRWVLRLVTRINRKIAVWSYYQQCLSFRALLQEGPVPALSNSHFPVDVTITQTLLVYLRQDIDQCVKMIDRQLSSLDVTMDEFLDRYHDDAQKQKARFLKLLKKELKSVAWEKKTFVQDTLKEEYRGLREMMNRFKNLCLKRALQVRDTAAAFMPNSMQSQVTPDTVHSEESSFSSDTPFMPDSTPQWPVIQSDSVDSEEERLSNDTSSFVPLSGSHGLTDNRFNDQLPSTLEELTQLLAEKDRPDQEATMRSFLEARLDECYTLIQSQLNQHHALVEELKSGSLCYQDAIPPSEALQRQLMACFKKDLLLFHPDKHASPKESIYQIQHACCCRFLDFRTKSIRQLNRDVRIMRGFIPQESTLKKQQRQREKSLEERLQEYTRLYQAFTEDYIQFYANEKARHDARIMELDATIAGIKALRTRQDATISKAQEMIVEVQEMIAETLKNDQENPEVCDTDTDTIETRSPFFMMRR